MNALLFAVVETFGFTEMQTTIVLISMLFFLASFFGGFLSSTFLAYGGAAKRRKAMDRMSVRMLLLAELFIVLWAFYYHAMVVVSISIEHIVFWVASLIIAPLLAFIGSEITHIVFRKKIEANYKAYAKKLAARKAKRAASGASSSTPSRG